MDASADQRLRAFAAEHHAVFKGVHARVCGLTDRQIECRIALSLWERLYDDVYVVAGAPLTWKGSLLAACWAGGFRAAASHRSAAALWQLAGGRRSIIEITCPRWRRAQHDGLVVHETKVLAGIDITEVDGIPVTSPERTLLDLGAVCHESLVEMALDKAKHRGLVTRASIEATLKRLGKRGRNGAGTLRRLVAAHGADRRAPESEMETALIRCLRRDGWPEPVPQYEIRQGGTLVARIDAAYPEWRIAIEYQSDAYHSGLRASERDNDRRLRIIAAGWFPIEATLPDVRDGGVRLCAALREAREAFLRQLPTKYVGS